MTPDEARRLLDGTTPGRWHVDPEHSGEVLSPKHHWLASTYETGEGFTADELARAQADAVLIAAAPILAALRAEMRPEYRVDRMINGHWIALALGLNTTWTDDKDRADGLADLSRAAGRPTRIVRRYVTEPESVE